MRQFRRALIAITIASAASAGVLISAPSSANASSAQAATAQQQASACRSVVVTGGRIAVREWPFVNADILRVRTRGQVLRSCKFVRGNGSNSYPNKCGASGRNWLEVNIPRTRTEIGFVVTKGYIAATCARYRTS